MMTCDECGDEHKAMRVCPKCGQSICPFCSEDGHDYMGEPCDGDSLD